VPKLRRHSVSQIAEVSFSITVPSLEWVFAKSPEIRSLVNKASKYFHVLIYELEHTVITCLCFFFKLYCVWLCFLKSLYRLQNL